MAAVQEAIADVDRTVLWEYDDLPFFDGEVEPCINGRLVTDALYFGRRVDGVVERLLADQMADGGWNCEAPESTRSSFHSTICVLEGLLEVRRVRGPDARLAEAVRAATTHEHVQQTALRATEDFAEGVRAVNERRPGQFKGR